MDMHPSEACYPSPPASTYSPGPKVVESGSPEDGRSLEDGQSTQSPDHTSVQDSSPVQKSGASTHPGAQPALPKKKPHSIAFSRGSNSDCEDEDSSTKRQRHEFEEPRIMCLGCPFYKRDPLKYQFCLSFQLRRIKDVKQHLYRKHSKPEFYCSRCFEIFPTASDRDVHTRPASCEMYTDPQYDGITEQQKKALTIYVNRGKRLEDQWYETYEIIFPGEPKPESAFVGSHFEEVIPLLRALWDTRQSGIIGQFNFIDQRSINAIMNTVFDQFAESIDSTASEQGSLSNTGLDAQSIETSRVSRRNSFRWLGPGPQLESGEVAGVTLGQSSLEEELYFSQSFDMNPHIDSLLFPKLLGAEEAFTF
jgi:hypothetical protein